MNNRDFEIMNQKLIDGYIARQKTHTYMLADDSYPDARKYRTNYHLTIILILFILHSIDFFSREHTA